MTLRITDDFTDLVMHVMAHVRMAGPGCLFSARYVAWAREHMPSPEQQWLCEGAEVLGHSWGQQVPDAAHAWPELFESIEAMNAAASVELAKLRPAQVGDARVLMSAQAVPGPALELLHATLGALAPWYAHWRQQVVVPRLREALELVQPWFEEAVRLLPSLGRSRVELAWALGGRGRAFGHRIVVGVPGEWNELDARLPAVVAMHEQRVTQSVEPGYVQMEWEALRGLAAIMHGADTELAEAHTRWLASIELRPLLDALLRDREIERDEHEALMRQPERRCARLAASLAR